MGIKRNVCRGNFFLQKKIIKEEVITFGNRVQQLPVETMAMMGVLWELTREKSVPNSQKFVPLIRCLLITAQIYDTS